MAQTTTAIYENGVLRPLVSLDLPEHSEVEITLEDSDSMRDRIDKALGSLIMKFDNDVEPISDERRAELARYSRETGRLLITSAKTVTQDEPNLLC